jgi:hypothetical protein
MSVFEKLFGKSKKSTKMAEFNLPQGRFMAGLGSRTDELFNLTLDKMTRLAEAGDRSGINEMEEFVRVNRKSTAEFTFYEAGHAVFRNPALVNSYPERILKSARSEGLFENPGEIQDMITGLDIRNKPALIKTLQQIESTVSWRESRALEILYAHVVILAKYNEFMEIH